MSSLEKKMIEFRDAQKWTSKGQLAVALHITRIAKREGLPLDPESLVTPGTGQVAGLSKGAVQSVLMAHGISQVLAQEGGRTSRGSLGNMRHYVAFLNTLHSMRLDDLDKIEVWWVARVKEYFEVVPHSSTTPKKKYQSYNLLDIPQERGADGSDAGVELESEEETSYPFDPDRISISSSVVPLSYLIERIADGSIRAPELQREANLWPVMQQSRLLESLMLRIPVPLFYVSVDKEEQWFVVDGLQRISAIRRYVVEECFPLSELEFLKECNGFYFSDLPQRYKKRIKETQFQFAIINATTPPNVQRNIFKRLNTGGLPLSAQEIRHALYYGNSAIFLKKLAELPEFLLATDGSVNDSRMAARELILRFIAFLIRGVEAYPPDRNMDEFLSETMQFMNIMPNVSLDMLKKAFYTIPSNATCRYTTFSDIEEKFSIAMHRAHEVFDEHAFRKSTPLQKSRSPINKALFETISVVLAEMPDEEFNHLKKNKEKMWEEYDNVLKRIERFVSRDSLKQPAVIARFRELATLLERFSQ